MSKAKYSYQFGSASPAVSLCEPCRDACRAKTKGARMFNLTEPDEELEECERCEDPDTFDAEHLAYANRQ